jgi:hypothetical protein
VTETAAEPEAEAPTTAASGDEPAAEATDAGTVDEPTGAEAKKGS